MIVAALICLVIAFMYFAAISRDVYGKPFTLAGAADLLLRCVFSYRDIHKPEGLYLRRFFITPRSWLGFRPDGSSRWPRRLSFVPVCFRKIFIHRILLSDDRTPHDHPWAFISRIIAGEYLEHITYKDDPRLGVYTKQRRCPSGTTLKNAATHVHRVEIVRPVWSLVLAGEAYRDWGFWVELSPTDRTLRWVDWRTFLGCPDAPTEPEDQYPGEFAALPTIEITECAPVGPLYDVPPVCGHAEHMTCLPGGTLGIDGGGI